MLFLALLYIVRFVNKYLVYWIRSSVSDNEKCYLPAAAPTLVYLCLP